MASILTGLTDQPNQVYPITLPDGSTATLTLQFWPQQLGWYYDLVWDGQIPSFSFLGQRFVASPNLLRQFSNVLPFGLAIVTTDGLDPTGQEDFVDGTCTMLLLSASDIAALEAQFFPGN